ncbi:MAG TPA: hypothetical protein VN240_11655, partial [Propylenella sp.]|nr:hypothetical protein [Propylenella sp.]
MKKHAPVWLDCPVNGFVVPPGAEMQGECAARRGYPCRAGVGQVVASRLGVVLVMLLCWIATAAAQQSTQPVADAQQSGQPAAVQQVCPPPDARVTAAYKYDPRRAADAQPDPATPVQLGEQVALKVDNLGALLGCYDDDPNNPLVLFLSGHPLKNLAAFPPSDPGDGVVYFELRMNDDTRDTWDHLLGSPPLSPISLQASMGPQDGYAIDSAAPLTLRVIPRVWLIVWIAIFVALCAAFFLLARRSNMLRGGGTVASVDSAAGPYSLAKTQAAWWFFVILAAYLLIGLITGDFSTSINGTALALLGIGAATAVGSAVIDASKDNPQNAAAQDAARLQAGLEIDQLEQEIP